MMNSDSADAFIRMLVELDSKPGKPADIDTVDTAAVLRAMFTENTGRHMLDSGGAYGRNWERNQLRVNWDTPTPATAHLEFSYRSDEQTVLDYVNIDAYQFLADRLDYWPELDRAFHHWIADSKEYWLSDMEQLADTVGEPNERVTVNTYNNEDALSQTLQYLAFEINPDAYGRFMRDNDEHSDDDNVPAYDYAIVLQVHGGADVRGGYSVPHAFGTYGLWDLADNADYDIVMTRESILVDTQQLLLTGMDYDPNEPQSWMMSYSGNVYQDDYGDHDDMPAGLDNVNGDLFDINGFDPERFANGERPDDVRITVRTDDDGKEYPALIDTNGRTWRIDAYARYPMEG